jgi:Flp pilus assembly protein TadB
MEKEMKELKQQRNLAQSRLEDLLRAIGEDRSSKQLVREHIIFFYIVAVAVGIHLLTPLVICVFFFLLF